MRMTHVLPALLASPAVGLGISMQRRARFNLDAVKAEVGKRKEQAQKAAKGTGD